MRIKVRLLSADRSLRNIKASVWQGSQLSRSISGNPHDFSTRKKTLTTRTQMLLAGGLTITLGFTVTIGVLSWQSAKEQKT